MVLYYSLFLFFFFLSFFDIEKVKTEVKTTVYYFGVCLLILLSGFRWKTGTDWDLYYYYFTMYDRFGEFNNGQFEILYATYTYLIKSFTDSYSVFLMISATIIIGIKAIMIKKLEPFFMVSLFAYYSLFIGDLFAVRQSLAISISLFSFYYIIKQKKLFFLISVIVATLVHNSAVVLFLAYPLFYVKINNKTTVVIIVLSLFLGVSGVMNLLLSKFQFLIEGFGGADSERIAGKLDAYTTEVSASKIDSNVAFLISALRRIIILPIILYFRKDVQSAVYDGYINLFTFSNVIFFTLSQVSIVFVRFTSYFTVIEILIIAMVLRIQKDKRKQFLLFVFFAIYMGFRIFVSLNTYLDLYDPYYWIFDKYIPRIPY